MKDYPPVVPRKVVRPRAVSPECRPIIAVSNEFCVHEWEEDNLLPAENLGKLLKRVPSSIIAVQGFGLHLQRLQRAYGDDPQFNYRVTPIRRYSRPWDDGRRLTQGMVADAVCNFVGWKAEGKAGRNNPNRYHYPLDPLWFLTSSIDELMNVPGCESDIERLLRLYEWGKEVRDWCQKNGLKVKASAGGIAAQLLRDPRFYPEPRRKAPRAVNLITRYRLPGNYYHLRAKPGERYRALYFDMENAHHVMARRLKFPDVNTLHAYGDMSWSAVEDKRAPRPFANGDSSLLEQPGLFHVSLAVPTVPRDRFPPPYMERSGIYDIWIYSNELPMIYELGGRIRCIYAAYTSRGFDTGLNHYARFAIEQIREHREYKHWLKPTLHCVYGLLAARALPFETGYWRASKGERIAYPMGNTSIIATAKIREAEIESRIVNVIHRGMIEAEVRKEALHFSRGMSENGHRVLGIYADGVFIQDKGTAEEPMPLRFLEPPWRLKEELSNLRFHSATTFTSHQLSRLPGVPRTARERYLAQTAVVAEVRKMRGRRRSRI